MTTTHTLPSGFSFPRDMVSDAFKVGFAAQTITGVLRRGNLPEDEAAELRDALAVLDIDNPCGDDVVDGEVTAAAGGTTAQVAKAPKPRDTVLLAGAAKGWDR